jgi:RHS repeat-associated protein
VTRGAVGSGIDATVRKMTVAYDPAARGVGEAGLFAKGVRNGIGYCGYMFNVESGLHTGRYRTHSPTLGRWLERDPAGYVDGMGLYEYVRGQPKLMLDPEELSRLSWLLKKRYMAVAKSSVNSAVRQMVENSLKRIPKGRTRDSAKEKEIQEILELAEEIEEAVESSGGSLLQKQVPSSRWWMRTRCRRSSRSHMPSKRCSAA